MKWSIPEKVIERGRQYVKEGRVLSVTPDAGNNVWHGEVLGSELYLVDLDATAKEEDYCQCLYWEEHHYCKHTVAVELYLRQEGKGRRIKSDDLVKAADFSPSEMFSSGFAHVRSSQGKQFQALQVQFQIEAIETNPFHPELSVLGISLKLGKRDQSRNYVVKNIYRFLQSYQEEKKLLVNKQYQFQLGTEAFTPDENSLLQELAGLAATQELIGQTGILNKGKLDKKYLMLPVALGRQLLEAMSELGGVLQLDTGKISPIVFHEGTPLHFSVTKDAEGFRLTCDRRFDALFSHYHWGVVDQQLYALTPRQVEINLVLEQLLKRLPTAEIHYPQKELSVLFMQVLPLLRQLGEVSVEEVVYDYISDQPLTVQFILRKKQGKVQVQLDYQYGTVVFSSDPKHTKEPAKGQGEVLRDYQKEERARHLLQQLGYRPNDRGFEKELPSGIGVFDLFTKEVPALRQIGEVLMGRKLRELYLDAKNHPPKLTVDQEGSWLDIQFDISGIDQKEIDAVLASLLANDRFYTLENGQVITFDSEEYQETSKALKSLREQLTSSQGHVQLPLSQGLALEERLDKDHVTFSEAFHGMVKDLLHPEEFPAKLPGGLNADLRSYQVTGFRWLKMLSHYHFGGILADEMGLGKTLQAITYLLSEKQAGELQGLIISPASLTYNWQQEFRRFAPELTTQVVSGNQNERQRLLAQPADVYITSYASLRQDIEVYRERFITHLILDEAQMVKNSTTKTAHALRSLSIDKRFALSGTPIENNLEELWSLFQMIMPGFFPTRQKFRELAPEEVAKMIRPFVLRRDKKTVLHDLQDKRERNYYSGLTPEQKTVYLAYLHQMQEQINGMDSQAFRKNRIGILAGLTRLRQICCDPKLFLDDYEGTSGKLEQVKDLVVAAKENGRRILLFSQFTGMLDIIQEEFTKLGLTSFYLRGSTPPKERIEMVDAFNAGEKDVFLISLKAGGTGLNLTGADTVILYDLWWNPAVEEQAAGRAHRIGQQKVVEVWRLIAEGTIEERIDLLQNEKRELFQKVISGNETQIQQLTEEDIRMILSGE